MIYLHFFALASVSVVKVTFLDRDHAKERTTSGCSRTKEDLRVFKKIVSGRFLRCRSKLSAMTTMIVKVVLLLSWWYKNFETIGRKFDSSAFSKKYSRRHLIIRSYTTTLRYFLTPFLGKVHLSRLHLRAISHLSRIQSRRRDRIAP